MVSGLTAFAAHFERFPEQYLLIGGTACDLLFSQQGLDFRRTRDFDLVVIVEAVDDDFVAALRDFIRMGGYQNKSLAKGKSQFFRFSEPTNKDYPEQLELFARMPDMFLGAPLTDVAPVVVEGVIESLSAIILDDSYYVLLKEHRVILDGLPVASAPGIILLKARAWLDLNERRNAGGHVDQRDINKHKNDVFRLVQLLSPDSTVTLDSGIKADLEKFLALMETQTIDFKSMGIRNMNCSSAIQRLKTAFGISQRS